MLLALLTLGACRIGRVWRAAAAKIQPLDVNKYDPIADQIFGDAVAAVLDGSKDIKTALTEANTLITRRAR